ncbi:sel1 repeat family protein [Desulfobulbus rhabdoformis]|uniref:tetratricopeptide repeat protein n=1 Tax=Desulfobulbus rhabdoformis TaxID=34032 RepID=UPI00196367EA|nr:tetratricopeptide repeat protein [Desulfobulbus rhabdoformis]MBM9615830.1 sel1 repeat family protein [Desulfobulbus rhabdoformis]
MNITYKCSLTLLCCCALVGCVQSTPKDTMIIHDETGFHEVPTSYSSFDSRDTMPAEDEARVSALEEIARKDPKAAYDLGLRYFRGDGVRQDSYQALQWMRQAAEHGDLSAQKALGRLYLTGLEEMGSDPQEAEKWLTIAAGRGDKESRTLLKQASAAKKSEHAYYRWKSEWRPRFYRYWYYDYPYRYYWRHGYWYYY